MTTVPLPLVLAVTGFACLVAALRRVFLHESATDRLINRALGLTGVGMILVVSLDPDDPTVAAHLRAVFGFLTASCVFGAARLLDGADPGAARGRQRRYDGAALAGIMITAVVDLACFAGSAPDAVQVHWYNLAGALVSVPLSAAGFLVTRAGIREIRSARTSFGRRLVFLAFVAVACFWICSSAILLVLYYCGIPSADPGTYWSLAGFFFFAMLAGLLAIPLAQMALVLVGLDRDSRDCRRLRPLWRDLTAAVPQVALTPEYADGRGSASRRYRMTVEIRDAMLHLRRHDADSHGDDLRAHTLRVVHAAEAGLVTEAVAGHDSELRALLELAARWPRAKRDYLAAACLPALSAVRP